MTGLKILAIIAFLGAASANADPRPPFDRRCEFRAQMMHNQKVRMCDMQKMREERQCRMYPNFRMCLRNAEMQYVRCTRRADFMLDRQLRMCRYRPW